MLLVRANTTLALEQACDRQQAPKRDSAKYLNYIEHSRFSAKGDSIGQSTEQPVRSDQLVLIQAGQLGLNLREDTCPFAVGRDDEADAEEHHLRHGQNLRQLLDRREGRRGDASLDLADHLRRKRRLLGKLRLSQVFRFPVMPQVRSENGRQ